MTRVLEEISSAVFRKLTQCGLQEKRQCPACLCDLDRNCFRKQCEHIMCTDCIVTMIQSMTREGQMKIKCVAEECGEFLAPMEIEEILFGSGADAHKLRKLVSVANQSALTAQRIPMKPCQTPDCIGLLRKTYNSEGKCGTCKRPFCSRCFSVPHPEETCEEHERLKAPDASVSAYVKRMGSNKVKNCPKCSGLVEKNNECNHIECKCGAHFCWLCSFLASSSGDCYKHLREKHNGIGGEEWHIGNNQVVRAPNEVELDVRMQQLLLNH